MSSLISDTRREAQPKEAGPPDVMGQCGNSPAADAARGRRLLRGWSQVQGVHGTVGLITTCG